MEQTQWVELISCTYRYQAEMLVEALEEAGIPTLIQGPEAGVFGYGFGGPTPKGITLSVPEDRLEDARRVLEERPVI
jgi:hypothetical protein